MSRRLRAALAAGPVPQGAPVSGVSDRDAGDRPATAPMPDPLVLDLVASLVEGGAPPRAALASVGSALRSDGDPRADELLNLSVRIGYSMEPRIADRSSTVIGDRSGALSEEPERLTAVVAEALWLAARSGLPPTSLIRRSAAEERRRLGTAQLRAVRRLEVLLVVPAGLCLLPAFILLGVVPVVLDLVVG